MQPLKQTRHRGLAGPAAADNSERVSDRDFEVDAVESEARRSLILEPQVEEFNVAAQGSADAMRGGDLLLRLIDQVADDGDRGPRFVVLS